MAPPPAEERRSLAGVRVVITAGGTREPIDPVRFLGNRSSGKMGNALAMAALGAGAEVTLITAAEPPQTENLRVIRVDTAAEMGEAVRAALPGARILLMAAAVADYRPKRVSPRKIKKGTGTWVLELEPTVDILTSLRSLPARAGVCVVGFAAETSDLLENAQTKLQAKGLDLIVLNDVSRPDIGMGSDQNEVTIIDAHGVAEVVARAPKLEVAEAILGAVVARMR